MCLVQVKFCNACFQDGTEEVNVRGKERSGMENRKV